MTVPRRRYTGLVYRAHHPMWAFQPLSGDGAKRFGGRFNRPGSAALYASLDLTTAWMEAQQGFPFKPQPLTMVAYQVDCTDVVDLHNEAARQCLAYTDADLACPWEDLLLQNVEPLTWVLAERLHTEGVVGILVRSFAPGSHQDSRNLVLWQWSDAEPHAIRLIDDQARLPKTQDSWN